jgi:hypothetical protein
LPHHEIEEKMPDSASETARPAAAPGRAAAPPLGDQHRTGPRGEARDDPHDEEHAEDGSAAPQAQENRGHSERQHELHQGMRS